MRIFLACALTLFIAHNSLAAEPINELFAKWDEAAKNLQSLVVEFDVEKSDPLDHRSDRFSGTFRLLKTNDARVFASYEEVPVKPMNSKQTRFGGLLREGMIYSLAFDEKKAIRFEPANGDAVSLLSGHFNPCIVVLDRSRAEATCSITIAKQEDWFTHVRLKPRKGKKDAPLAANFDEARIIVMRKGSEKIPQGMPRVLEHLAANGEVIKYDIKSWKINVADAPKPDEFISPEDLPGWNVVNWPKLQKH